MNKFLIESQNINVMKVKLMMILSFLMFMVLGAQAQTIRAKVNQTQARQHARIHHGMKNGELTKRETKVLRKQQRSVQRHKKHARMDGKVTRKEKAQIHRHQKVTDRSIKRKKHNPRKRSEKLSGRKM